MISSRFSLVSTGMTEVSLMMAYLRAEAQGQLRSPAMLATARLMISLAVATFALMMAMIASTETSAWASCQQS